MKMLKDYEYEFCMALHKKLKEKIKGKIFTTVKEDKLIVDITMGKVEFQMGFDNFAQRLSEGFTTDAVVVDVTKAYKSFLNDLYFA